MSGLSKARMRHISRLLVSIFRDLLYSTFISIPYAFYTLLAVVLFDAHLQNLDPPPTFKSSREHDAHVESLQEQLKSSYERNERVSILKKVGQGHSSRSNMYKHSHARLDFTKMNCLLGLDIAGKTAEVEAYVVLASLSSILTVVTVE